MHVQQERRQRKDTVLTFLQQNIGSKLQQQVDVTVACLSQGLQIEAQSDCSQLTLAQSIPAAL